MTLWLMGIGKDDKVFAVRGPYAEGDDAAIYSDIEDMERLYNMVGENVSLYPEPRRLEVVRVAHTMRYRE